MKKIYFREQIILRFDIIFAIRNIFTISPTQNRDSTLPQQLYKGKKTAYHIGDDVGSISYLQHYNLKFFKAINIIIIHTSVQLKT